MKLLCSHFTLRKTAHIVKDFFLKAVWSPPHRSSRPEVFYKKVFLEISQNSQKNICARASFLIKLQALNFTKKETLAQVFSCEFCEISKNTFFTEHFRWLLLSTQHAIWISGNKDF